MLCALYTEGMKFGAYTLENSSLGGSESALVYMSRELSKLGHDVKVFCRWDKQYPKIDSYGITWFDISELPSLVTMFQFDVFLCYRYYSVFANKINSKLNILVNHDVLTEKEAFMTNIWQVDNIFNLSKFHVDLYLDKLPELKSIMWQTKNGVDLSGLNKSIEGVKKEKRIIYASAKERGLDRLLAIWDNSLRKKLPGYELAVCGYELDKDLWATIPPQQRAFYRNLDMMMNSIEGVVNYGALKKEDYWKLLASSKVMAYCTHFPEISCINSLEAMACGTMVVTTDDFALSETVGQNGILIKGNPDTKEYMEEFSDKLVKHILKYDNDNRYRESVTNKMQSWVKNYYNWTDIAHDWNSKFNDLFQDRFNAKKTKVIDNLLYNSDVIAALKISKEEGLKDYVTKIENILQECSTFKDEYDKGGYLIFENKKDYERSRRFAEMIEWMDIKEVKSLLDIGCHWGSFAISASNCIPDLKVDAVDLSPKCIESAIKLRDKFATNKKNINFNVMDLRSDDLKSLEGKYDGVFAGELLEHIIDLKEALSRIESVVKEGGWIFITVPFGPWEMEHWPEEPDIFHVHGFEIGDLKDIFGKKNDFALKMIPAGVAKKGELLGWWAIWYKKDSTKPTGAIDYERKKRTRPYQKLSAGLITLNEENNLSRCLKSIKDIVDEIVICDTGSTDLSLDIAKKYTDKIYNIGNDPDKDGKFNFAWARNEVLSRISPDADWHIWLDADEELIHKEKLKKYLNSTVYNGFVLYQCHLIHDMEDIKPDTPIRIFKTDKDIKFYGIIHEQAMHSINDHIFPALVLQDTRLLHYGYTTEQVRRDKCANRNLALLMKDRKTNPDRKITMALMMRDYLNLTNWEAEGQDEMLTEKAILYLRTAYRIFQDIYRGNKDSQYYALAFSLYQAVLEKLGKGNIAVYDGGLPPINVALALAGNVGELSRSDYKANTYWFADADEYKEWVLGKSEELLTKMNYPTKRRS